VQTTLLGLAIAFIIALMAALVGPYFIDWNQFRPQFEAEASRIVGAPVRVAGKLDARLLPAPSLQLRSVTIGGANDLGKVRAEKLDVEFSLGSLMRGEVRATELTVNGLALDLGLDGRGRIDWSASTGSANLGSLAIDRLNLTGRVALHDAASRSTLELNDIAFSGDVRSLAGSIRGDGNFMVHGVRYPFRVSSGQTQDGNGTRVRFIIDPAQRPLAIDLEGVLNFDQRAPSFEGTATLAAPATAKGVATPWKIVSKVKADYAAARLDQIEVNYGPEDRALRFTGSGDVSFGAKPLLRASLSARQLDADRFAAKDNAAEPVRVLPAMRALLAGLPPTPIPTQIEFSSEQIMLGGRPLQDVVAGLYAGSGDWSVRQLEFRAPGTTRVSLSGARGQNASPDNFKAALSIDSSDPDALMTWLQGRGDLTYRSQKPLRLRGDVSVAPDNFAIDGMRAEFDAGTVEGRIAVSHPQPNGGARVDADLKAERLDLDAARAFVRSLAGPQAEWPEQAQLSLNVGHAISSGQELRPLSATLGYDPKTISLHRLKIGRPDGVTMEGEGRFDRTNATGKLALNSSAASFNQLTALIAPFAPSAVARLDAMGTASGPARAKLSIDLDQVAGQTDRASARVVLDLDAPQLKGVTTLTAKPPIAAINGIDVEAIKRSEVAVDAKLSTGQGGSLLALLGLDRAIAAGEGAAQFEGSASGAWGAPVQLKAKISGADLDAEAQGTAEPWAQEVKANVSLKVGSINLAPLLDLKPSDKLAQHIGLTSRLTVTGNKWTFDDLDSSLEGSRLRGRLALTLDQEKAVEGEIGLDTLALVPSFALAIGAAGHDADEPLGAGLVKGWRGRVAFQALRGVLPGGVELQQIGGTVKADGQSLTLDDIKGRIGGGDLTANIDVRPGANGLSLNARLQLSGVDGSALRYRALAMPAGRASVQMALASQGRSASALIGALSGNGTVTLESAKFAGLDPRAFEVAVRASDNGQAKDDIRLKQIVEPALSAGALMVASAQIPFIIRDGRMRVSATTIDTQGVRAVISGGYDIPADQADIRAALALTMALPTTGRPEIQLFAAGTPDAMSRSVDVAALSSWLAVRAIDHETRRLDAIERGEPPPPPPAPITIPADAAQDVMQPPREPLPPVPLPPRRTPPPKAKATPPRQPAPPAAHAPTPAAPQQQAAPSRPPAANAPTTSQQQAAPLPPPIEVRPAPGAAAKPRPKPPPPPLALTPQLPPRPPAPVQN
jgi:hypothetical protein